MMDPVKPSWMNRVGNAARSLFWMLLLLSLAMFVVSQFFGSRGIQGAREDLLKSFEQERKSRVIAMIHRQESVSILGVPVSSHITIEDSEAVLRAIRLTPPDQPIDLILHTPGGLVLAAEQITKALVEHKGKVTVFVPHYAMSGGTLIALAADEIVTLVVQVNGKVRGKVEIGRGADEAAVIAAAQANENVLRFLEGKSVRKTVVIPDKLVNLVVG